MELAYYPGCSLQQSSALYDVQTRRVFNKLGINLVELEDWNCCGATSAGKTNDFLAIAMPARNLGIAAQTGLDTLLIPCSACYSRTMVAQQYLAAHPEKQEQINDGLVKKIDGDVKVSSILEALLTTLDAGGLTDALVRKPAQLKPVCYYGCMMTRFPFEVPVPDDIENPMGMDTIVEAMGIHAIDWNYKTNCCGASAAVNDPDTAFHLMSKIMTDAINRSANCIITTCPMCQLNLDAYQAEFCRQYNIEERLPVFFITEVLGMAMGLDFQELQVDRHFIDGADLFKEMEPYE